MLRGELEREVWTCKRPNKLNLVDQDIEEVFQYPCFSTVDLTLDQMKDLMINEEQTHSYSHIGIVKN